MLKNVLNKLAAPLGILFALGFIYAGLSTKQEVHLSGIFKILEFLLNLIGDELFITFTGVGLGWLIYYFCKSD